MTLEAVKQEIEFREHTLYGPNCNTCKYYSHYKKHECDYIGPVKGTSLCITHYKSPNGRDYYKQLSRYIKRKGGLEAVHKCLLKVHLMNLQDLINNV